MLFPQQQLEPDPAVNAAVREEQLRGIEKVTTFPIDGEQLSFCAQLLLAAISITTTAW